MKLHYKIISTTSQDSASPVTNLLLGNGIWQSSRFCSYPQQITLQFYEPVTISSIHIASHNIKIASKVNVLFCLEQNGQSNKFQKFGFFQFSDNLNTDLKMREMKKLQQININATHMRLILWKNHQNTQNFFNQIGLTHLTVYGNPYQMPRRTIPPVIQNKSTLSIPISQYIDSKLQVLQQFKQQFSKHDDFENAKKVKQIIRVIRNHGEKLKVLDLDKKNAIGVEEYDKAKVIKAEMEDLKNDIEYVSNNFYDPNKKSINPVLKDTKLKIRIDEMLGQNNSMHESRLSTKLKKVQIQILKQQKQIESQQQQQPQQQQNPSQKPTHSRVSYDNRIIPAILHKNKKQHSIPQNNAQYEDNQFLQKSNNKQQQAVLQDMTPSAQVNAAVLLQFYDKQVVKKLHSKHWNFKLEALNVILDDVRKWVGGGGELEKNRVKAVLFTFNKIIKQGNFQLNNLNLDLLLQLISSKKSCPKSPELHPQLQKCLNQLFLKMSDSQKIKQKIQQILTKMLTSELYGTNLVYSIITKSYFNQGLTHNVKIKKYKLAIIQQILMEYGIGNNSKNGLPIGAVQFVCRAAEDTNDQVRKQATGILKAMKSKGAGNKVIEVVRSRQTLKGSIVKELQA